MLYHFTEALQYPFAFTKKAIPSMIREKHTVIVDIVEIRILGKQK